MNVKRKNTSIKRKNRIHGRIRTLMVLLDPYNRSVREVRNVSQRTNLDI